MSTELQSQIERTKNQGWRRVCFVFLHLLFSLNFCYFCYVLFRCFLQFVAINLFWYIPGVQFFDRLLYKAAYWLNLVYIPVDRRVNRTPVWSSSWLISSWMCLLIMLFSFAGTRRLIRKRFEGSSMTKRTLDRLLITLMISLSSTILTLSPLLVSGAVDYFEWQLANGHQTNPYLSSLCTLLPASLRMLPDSLFRSFVLRFPLLLWSIVLYRFVLLVVVVTVGLYCFRDFAHLVLDLRSRRPSVQLHLHPHID